MSVVTEKSQLYIEQMYTGCLAEAAYYVESGGEVAIIDPMRETEPYLSKARERGATIRYVFETHFHADFVSGHLDLARQSGARIVYGPGAETAFESIVAKDGQEFELGRVRIKVLHTPGHTPESSCYLLYDENGKETAVFTGDTLFIGEVGRPDLAIKSDLTREDLAGMLYDSLHNKLMPLPDHVLVYPAHGAGSACGKNISSERWSTIGAQKTTNYALQPMSKEEFIREVSTGILPPPQYFPKNALLNKTGYEHIDQLLDERTKPLDLAAFKQAMEAGALVLDTRKPQEFGAQHIPGSINIGLDGSFASWVGTLIEDLQQPLLLITAPGREREATLRLARVGYTNSQGYLQGGISTWKAAGEPTDRIPSVQPAEFEQIWHTQRPLVLDVRKPTEYQARHLREAISFPLDYLNAHLHELDPAKQYYLHCKSGYRSMVAASILKRHGFRQLVNVDKGIEGIAQTSVEITDNSCPSGKR